MRILEGPTLFEEDRYVTKRLRPLTARMAGLSPPPPVADPGRKKSESLTVRPEDEIRVSASLVEAAKKHATGGIFSVKIDMRKTGTLGIGVKDLPDKLLVVSMLKRTNSQPGAGESAGIRLGDVIFGINFVPTREGSQTLLQVMKLEASKGKKTLHIQCWRCHQLCIDPLPGSLFPRADDVIVQAHELFRTKVLSDWERWNFIEILLGNMLDDLKFRAAAAKQQRGASAGGEALISPIASRDRGLSSLVSSSSSFSSATPKAELDALTQQKAERARQMRVVDLERNILQAKGLRAAICVRIVHTKQVKEAVLYVLRVEDVETGLQWVVNRRYRDFHALNEELLDMSHFTRDVEFPQKRLSIRSVAKLVESRIVALEQYLRRVLHLLTLYATMDPVASRSLRRLQNFLGVDKYIDCIHPPLVDDQRHIELMAYRFLNDFSSPACQQCVRFVTNVDLDSMVTPGEGGHKAALSHVRQALNEVEQFVLQQHQQQMIQELSDRKPGLTQDQLQTFVRRCVRRQVEAAIFLPLRRHVFRIVYSFVAREAQRMQRAMAVLQQATPEYFMVPPHALVARQLPRATRAFRDVVHAYLPADQGQLLLHAAAAVMELHTECIQAASAAASSAANNSTAGAQRGTGKANSKSDLSVPSTPMSSVSQTVSPVPADLSFSPLPSSLDAAAVSAATRGADVECISIRPEELHEAELNWHSSPSITATDLHRRWNSDDAAIGRSRRGSGGSLGVDFTADQLLNDDSDFDLSTSRRLSTPNLDSSAAAYAIKPQSRLSLSVRDKANGHGHAGLAPPTYSIDLTDPATLADPVREMFASVETVPGSVVRKGPDRASLSLSFLGDGDCDGDEDGDGEGDREEREKWCAGSDEGGEAEKVGLAESREGSLQNLSNVAEAAAAHPPDPVSPTTPLAPALAADQETDTEADVDEQGLGISLEGAISTIIEGPLEEHAFTNEEAMNTSELYENIPQHSVVSADDFLPMFTFCVVQAALPQLLIVKELMTALVDDEESFGECGYYIATMEASTIHIVDLAEQFEGILAASSSSSSSSRAQAP